MTDRIKEFLARNTEDGPRLVVDLDVVRENYLGFAGALPDTRVFYAVKANPAPEILVLLAGLGSCFRHRLADRDRAGPRRRRDAGPDQLRQHDQEGKGHRPRLRARHPPFCRGQRGGGREDRPRRPGDESVLPHLVRRRRRRMAAVAQVRLRAGNGRSRARARPCARPRRPWPVVPRRLAAAQPADVGQGAESVGGNFPRPGRTGRPACHDQSRRRLPDPLSERRAGDQNLWADDLPRAAAPFRQPHPGDDHRTRPRHGRQRRHHRGRGGADLEKVGRGQAAAGSISTSASSTGSPRRWTR